jgi:hypothetical protein
LAWSDTFERQLCVTTTDRFFFHSFPRRAKDETPADQLVRGLNILRTIKEIGLVLAPEIVSWSQPTISGTPRQITYRQQRLCFTELARTELPEHSKRFGPFSLQFSINTLRRLGALPVIYLPQNVKTDTALSSAGAVIAATMGDIKYTLGQLQQLSRLADLSYVRTIPGAETASSVSADCILNLQNKDEAGNVVATYQVPLRHVLNFLEYLGFRNPPFELMAGILNLTQSLFYPTDDERHDEHLAYYRQREWRITAGMRLGGVQHGHAATDAERKRLLEIDRRFWNKEESDKDGTFRRIDYAYVIDRFEGAPIFDAIEKVIVPDGLSCEAVKLFGDKVQQERL